MLFKAVIKTVVSVALLGMTNFALAQDGYGSDTFGIGYKGGMSLELGQMHGWETYYKSGNWQYEFYMTSSSVDMAEEFAKEAVEPSTFAGQLISTIDRMDVTTDQLGLNLRWFFNGSVKRSTSILCRDTVGKSFKHDQTEDRRSDRGAQSP